MSDDDLPFELEEHDLRGDRAEWVYVVRAVRRGESLTGPTSYGDMIVLLGVLAALAVVGRRVERWQEQQPWKVGVIRIRSDRWGATGGACVVHREQVEAREAPLERLAALAERVRAGDFDD